MGSNEAIVSLFAGASSKCQGMKRVPGGMVSETLAADTISPLLELILTEDLSLTPIFLASFGFISTNGDGISLLRVGDLPVIDLVCQWKATLPVVSIKGYSLSGSSAGG